MPSVQPPIPPKAKPEVLSEELIVDIEQLTKFYNSDFESLSIQDLRELKTIMISYVRTYYPMETTKATAKFMLTAEQTQSTKLEATQIH